MSLWKCVGGGGLGLLRRTTVVASTSPMHLQPEAKPNQRIASLVYQQVRTLIRIPLHEYHVRFDAEVGKKIPNQDVLDKFKRLNNGLWIRGRAGRTVKRYQMTRAKAEKTFEHVMCNRIECEILDKLVSRYWVRPRYYIEDPYEQYHVRHNLNTPRLHLDGRLKRERTKILLDDTTSDQHFHDR